MKLRNIEGSSDACQKEIISSYYVPGTGILCCRMHIAERDNVYGGR